MALLVTALARSRATFTAAPNGVSSVKPSRRHFNIRQTHARDLPSSVAISRCDALKRSCRTARVLAISRRVLSVEMTVARAWTNRSTFEVGSDASCEADSRIFDDISDMTLAP